MINEVFLSIAFKGRLGAFLVAPPSVPLPSMIGTPCLPPLDPFEAAPPGLPAPSELCACGTGFGTDRVMPTLPGFSVVVVAALFPRHGAGSSSIGLVA